MFPCEIPEVPAIVEIWAMVKGVDFWFGVSRVGNATHIKSAIQGYLAHKKHHPLGPYRRTKPRALWCLWGGRLFLMSEVSL